MPSSIATTEYVDEAIAKITETNDIIISGSEDDGIWTLLDSTATGTERIWISPTVIDNLYSAYKIYWSKQIDPDGCWVLYSYDDIPAANQNEFGLENPWNGTWSNNITVKCGSKYATTEYVDEAIANISLSADTETDYTKLNNLPTLSGNIISGSIDNTLTNFVKNTIVYNNSDTINISDNKIHIKFANTDGISITSAGISLDFAIISGLLGLTTLKTDIEQLKAQLSGVNDLLNELNGE